MKQSVAIYTLYKGNKNYGGLLQAYALQKVIENKGYACEVISYTETNNKKIINKLVHVPKRVLIKLLFNKVKKCSCILSKNYRKEERMQVEAFENFEKIIPHTAIFTPETIKECGKKYDVFVTGSDQVWSPNCWNQVSFLEFVPNSKVKFAYAASLGSSNFAESEKVYIREHLKKLDKISVREQTAQKFLQETIGRNVSLVLDPTLLLTANMWRENMQKLEECPQRYVFLYSIGKNKKIKKELYEYCKQKGLPIVTITHLQTGYKREDILYSDIPMCGISPMQWVWLIENAELVVTDSFHGTAFSINLNKDFYCFGELGNETRIERMQSFLAELGLENRILSDFRERDNEPIDYIRVNQKLEEMRTYSMKYIDMQI